MKCMVQNCTSDTKRTNKCYGITFHRLPKEAGKRTAWMVALKMTVLDMEHRNVVCSRHFHNKDFYINKAGLRNIKKGALPFYSEDTSNDLDTLATLKACRICLTTDAKLYDVTDRGFNLLYTQLTGLSIESDDKLPQMLCWECAHRLTSYNRFRSRALSSHKLMVYALGTEQIFTLRHLQSINRLANGLCSSLIQKVYEPNDCDLSLEETLPIKVELCNGDVTDDQIDACEDAEATDVYDAAENDVAEEIADVKLEAEIPLVQVEVKSEGSAIFFNENDNFDSDDNLKLSEVFRKSAKFRRKEKVKRKRPKVEKTGKSDRSAKVEKLAKKKTAKVKKPNAEDDPEGTADKFKLSEVKRRKANDGLDITLFTITQMTYEEQIQEIEKRRDTLHYKDAPFKCDLCYRGFLSKERYEVHAVRHSEQSGAFECFICKTRLKTGRALRKHVTAQHTEKFSCTGCRFVTRNRGVAREHERWHAGTKYQCPHCASEFDKLTTYMGHIRIKHASDYVCELCGYTFVSQKGIEVHKKKKHRLHDAEVTLDGPYCDVCNVRFISEEAHTRHLKLSSKHSSEGDPNRIRNDSQSTSAERRIRPASIAEKKPVVLPQVPEEENVADNGPITCEQCGLQMRDLRLYAQHFRRTHPDKNRTKYPAMRTPCMCEQCGRIFQSMALLKDHMWVHTGEKRFKCSSCDKSFTQKSNLVFHLRVHSAQRPSYECPLCGKQFAFFNNRRRHMFIHTGLKPFRCDTCSKCFTTAGEQRAHVQHVHMKKPWPKRARLRREWTKAPM